MPRCAVILQLKILLVIAMLLVACGESGIEEVTRINNETTPVSSSPIASNVTISDENGYTALVGDILSGDYEYFDADNDDEGATSYRWLRDGKAIGGAGGTGKVAREYILVDQDLNKTIVFEVTPVSLAGKSGKMTGDPVPSSEGIDVVANSAPNAINVGIIRGENTAYAVSGDTLEGTYTYKDVDNDPEGASIYRWLRDDKEISGATDMSYILTAAEVPFEIRFEVTPVASGGSLTGAVVTSLIGINARRPLNDTGITRCGDYAYTDTGTNYNITGSSLHNNMLDCSTQATVPTQKNHGYDADGDIVPAGQDALYGRDVTDNDNSDGHAGFSYTKLDNNGVPLSNQSIDYATQPWSCVKDNVTGLTWEVKTPATGTGLQSSSYTYTWHNSSGRNDGGDWGIGDTGVGVTSGFETANTTIYAGSDNCANSTRCDTEKYTADVNASNNGAGLCGATDWRLPDLQELGSIINYNQVTLNQQTYSIDINYFPNSDSARYWASSPYAGSSNGAWVVNFGDGFVYNLNKSIARYVRLVRGSQ